MDIIDLEEDIWNGETSIAKLLEYNQKLMFENDKLRLSILSLERKIADLTQTINELENRLARV